MLDRLRLLSRSREVVLVRGNHDLDARPDFTGNHSNGNGFDQGFGPHKLLSSLIGVPLFEDYKLDIGGRPYLFLHGDRFDPTLNLVLV